MSKQEPSGEMRELWPGGPLARTRLRDGTPAAPPGWVPPPEEMRPAIERVLRKRDGGRSR